MFRLLGSALRPPYRILYILHTSLADAPLGRYESPNLDGADVEEFSRRFGTFIAEDARHDVWLQSKPDGGPIVIDRYNLVYAYGPLDRFSNILEQGGIAEVASWAAPTVPYPHALHYHPELNALQSELLAAFPWVRKPLRDTDVQFWSGPKAT